MNRRTRCGWIVLAAVVFAGTTTTLYGAGSSAAVAATQPGPALSGPTQPLVALVDDHEAFAQPNAASLPLVLVSAHRPLTGEQTVLPVVGSLNVRGGARWLDVLLPGRPNGRTGWISARNTVASTTSFAIIVDTATRRLTVFQYGHSVLNVSVVVGKSSTPTPLGKFFVEEVVQLSPRAVGAPYAFALSARSNVLQEFDGGPGQIALHGLGNIGGVLGTAVSHGCVRLATTTLAWMVTRISPGVRVTIEN